MIQSRVIVGFCARQSPSTTPQTLQVVAPDFVLQQLEQRAFMTRDKDIQALALRLPRQIKNNHLLFNIQGIFT